MSIGGIGGDGIKVGLEKLFLVARVGIKEARLIGLLKYLRTN